MPNDMTWVQILLLMLAGHALADYPLQGDFVAQFKNRHTKADQRIWPWVLSAHAAIHAAVVGLITGSTLLGVLEFAIHWIIDLLKCEKRYGFHTDQLLHLGCKLLWVLVLLQQSH